MIDINVFIEGLSLGASLIIAIGVQNIYVMKQGILRKNVFINAFICSFIDIILITTGVLGMGMIISKFPILIKIVSIGGAIFLLYYGITSFILVIKPKTFNENEVENKSHNFKNSILPLLFFSLLNPHVYLDTVILLGGIGARHPENQRLSFIIGTSTASIIWFFSLSYFSRILTPLFKKKITWRILDFIMGCIMIFIAAKLILFVLK